MELLRWIVGLTITAVVASLAVMNRASVNIFWSPLHESYAVPLYGIILFSIAFGFIFGGGTVWLNMSSLRRKKREQKREIHTLEKEVAKLKEETSHPQTLPAQELFTALPPKL